MTFFLLFLLFIFQNYYLNYLYHKKEISILFKIHPVFLIGKTLSSHIFKMIKDKIILKKQEEEIPKLIKLLISYLKAGVQLSQVFKVIENKKKWPLPIQTAIYKINRYYSQGMNFDQSIYSVTKSIKNNKKNYYLLLLLNTIKIGYMNSGNLVTILEKIDIRITEKLLLEKKMSATTAQIRFQSFIIGIFPLFIAFIIWIISPSYILFFFQNKIGILLLIIMILLNTTGFYILKKMAQLK